VLHAPRDAGKTHLQALRHQVAQMAAEVVRPRVRLQLQTQAKRRQG
jgi:hypothetical protein